MNDESMQRMMRAATNTKRAMVARAMVMAMRVAGNKESKVSKVMAMGTRVECNKEGNVDSGKSTGNKGGRQATATRAMEMAMLTTWAMVMVMRKAGDKEGKGKGYRRALLEVISIANL
jgi:hypothetical protein